MLLHMKCFSYLLSVRIYNNTNKIQVLYCFHQSIIAQWILPNHSGLFNTNKVLYSITSYYYSHVKHMNVCLVHYLCLFHLCRVVLWKWYLILLLWYYCDFVSVLFWFWYPYILFKMFFYYFVDIDITEMDISPF